jgi:hypothetical protein
MLHALHDLSPEKHPRLGREIFREQQSLLAERDGEHKLLEEVIDRDAAVGRIMRHDTVGVGCVFEFFGGRPHDDVVTGQLAVVDLRVFEREFREVGRVLEVSHPEDRASVQEAIRGLVRQGVYPKSLWA